jgi:hypothetical protein
MKSESPFEGMIAGLTSKHGGNVCDRGIVAISGSIYNDSASNAARNAADLTNTSNYFNSKCESNQWLCYDFKNRKVRLTHYSIHPHSSSYCLRSWIVEGSLDGSKWFVLDRRENNDEMTSSHPIGIFTVSQSDESRFIRLRQLGKNAGGNDHLTLYAFELFGQLIE